MISIVIPAYNEEKVIQACLESFLHQTTKQSYEIILVNNASTDATEKIANTYKSKLPLTIIHEPKQGRSPARRAGFAKASGDIILSTDADAVVPSNWIDGMTEAFNDPKVVAVTGTCKIEDVRTLDKTIFNALQPWFMRSYRVCIGHYWLTGSNFAIRKQSYSKAGGFDTELNAMEDIHLSPKINDLGKIIFNPRLPVTVSGRRFEKNLVKGLLEYGWSYGGYALRRRQKAHLSDAR